MDSLKTTELAPSAPPDVLPAQLLQLATPVPMSEETQPTTAPVLPVSTMLVSTNALPAAQAVLLVQAPPLVPAAMPESSGPLTILFVFAKKDTSNLSSKTEPELALHAQKNANHALKAPWNALVATQLSTELKVTTHWVTEPAFADQATRLLPMEDVSNPTVNQTNGALNVKPTLLCVSNVKPMLTESLSSPNTFVSALMVSMKELTELVFLAQQDVPSALQLLSAMLVLSKPPATETELVNVPLELSSESLPMVSDTANNVSNTVMLATTD